MNNTNYYTATTLIENIFSLFSGITQKKVCDIFGFSKNQVSRWKTEETTPSIDQLQLIVNRCRVDWDYIFTGKSSDPTVITNAYFPILLEESDLVVRKEFFIQARVFAISLLKNQTLDNAILSHLSILISKCLLLATDTEAYPFQKVFEHSPPYTEEECMEIKIKPTDFIKSMDQTKNKLQKMYKNFTGKDFQELFSHQNSLQKENYDLLQETYNYDYELQQIESKLNKLPDIAPEDFREIPFYPDEIAAGQPLEIRDAPEGIVIIHKDWCKNKDNMVAVRVSSTGTSMEPTIPAGAIVTIDTTPISPERLLNMPVALYKKDDGATIKRLRKTARGWCGVPDNRDPEHEIIIIEEGDRIIGKINSVHYAL